MRPGRLEEIERLVKRMESALAEEKEADHILETLRAFQRKTLEELKDSSKFARERIEESEKAIEVFLSKEPPLPLAGGEDYQDLILAVTAASSSMGYLRELKYELYMIAAIYRRLYVNPSQSVPST